jgi:hypothetical protein
VFRLLKNWINILRFNAENKSKTPKKPIPPDQWALNASVQKHQKQPFASEAFNQLETHFTPEKLTRFLPPATTWAGLESLQTLEWLSVFLHHPAFPSPPKPAKLLRWLDVGSKNFAYAPALAVFLQHWINLETPWQLTGIELDAGRLDAQGISRTAYANGIVNLLPNTTYRSGDMLEETQQYEGISLFLPFVFEDPLVSWGLPTQQFKPLAILTQCVSLLTQGGVLLIINLTHEEAAQQEQLFQQLPDALQQQLTWVKLENPLPNSFINWQYERIAWLCTKHPPLHQPPSA